MSTTTTPTPADLGLHRVRLELLRPGRDLPLEGLTLDMVAAGCQTAAGPDYCQGDGTDRENVRDFVLNHHGLTFPDPPAP